MTTEELKALPVEEKLHIMEVLWDDLQEQFRQAPISQEQKQILDERRRRVRSGEAKLLDWDAVKNHIGQR